MHATDSSHSHQGTRRRRSRDAGFSLTELLVVIGIIVLLVGLLLVALGQVQKKARRTQTENTMQQFANACAAFQTVHGIYPGIIPEDVLAQHPTGVPPISGTENALLHLMGGARVLRPIDAGTGNAAEVEFNAWCPTCPVHPIGNPANAWRLKFDLERLGEGPVIDGKPYPPYFTPSPGELRVISGQLGPAADLGIPDLVDAWGQPIIYLRQARGRGPLVEDENNPPSSGGPQPQFVLAGVVPYLRSPGLGEFGYDQDAGSIFGSNPLVGTTQELNNAFAALLAHQAFYKRPSDPPPAVTNPLYGTARGSFVLISAGPDGIFFSRADGPGATMTDPTNNSQRFNERVIEVGPRAFDEFDDIRVYGGG